MQGKLQRKIDFLGAHGDLYWQPCAMCIDETVDGQLTLDRVSEMDVQHLQARASTCLDDNSTQYCGALQIFWCSPRRLLCDRLPCHLE